MIKINGFHARLQGQIFFLRGEKLQGGVKIGNYGRPHLKIEYFY